MVKICVRGPSHLSCVHFNICLRDFSVWRAPFWSRELAKLQTNPTVEAGPAVTGHLFPSSSELLQGNLATGNSKPYLWNFGSGFFSLLAAPLHNPFLCTLVSFFWPWPPGNYYHSTQLVSCIVFSIVSLKDKEVLADTISTCFLSLCWNLCSQTASVFHAVLEVGSVKTISP